MSSWFSDFREKVQILKFQSVEPLEVFKLFRIVWSSSFTEYDWALERSSEAIQSNGKRPLKWQAAESALETHSSNRVQGSVYDGTDW